jgi:hypothetical protein
LLESFRKAEVDIDDSSRLAIVAAEASVKLFVGLSDHGLEFLLKATLMVFVFLSHMRFAR